MTTPIFPNAAKQMTKPSRRRSLQCSFGACSEAALIHRMPAKTAFGPYYKAVFDERFEDACVFATQVTARETRTAAICGDITSIYFDDLDLRWKQGPIWLTGLTHVPTSDPPDLAFWIIAPNARAAQQERANA
jgi:hypothetical protein